MGQYWKVVNLTKKEFVHPHKLGSGLKLIEQVGTHPGTGAALLVLLAAMPESRGAGDLNLDEGLDGYIDIAERTIGRWSGDRIALVGNYAEDSDLPDTQCEASKIYDRCDPDYWPAEDRYTDISDDVCRVLEYELGGKFSGDGWRDWQ